MRPRNLTPPLKCDKQGYAYVQHASIPNRSHRLSLGKFGTPEANRRYQQFLERLRIGQQPVTVHHGRHNYERIADLVPLWEEHADRHYLRNGVVSQERHTMRWAIDEMLRVCGDDYALTFGPAKLLMVRDAMAASGRFSRKTVNSYVSRIRRFWKWACSRELVDPSIYPQLQTVEGLQPGQGVAPESAPVPAACLKSFNAVLPYCSPVVQDMMRVQFLCVMRPSEVCEMHRDGIDRSGDLWLYNLATHKTAWRGKTLIKAIPNAAREIIEPRLETDTGYLFDPEEARAWGRTEAAKARGPRTTTRYPSEAKRLAASKSHRRCSGHYSVSGYRTAIDRAFARAEKDGLAVERFSPNQIRHAAVTWVDEHLNDQDAAQKLAGHDKAATTDIYRTHRPERLIELAQAVDAALDGR